jgi:hypothetical protein
MTSEPEPDSSYPDAWIPRHIRQRKEVPPEMERRLGLMTDAELDALIERMRGPR